MYFFFPIFSLTLYKGGKREDLDRQSNSLEQCPLHAVISQAQSQATENHQQTRILLHGAEILVGVGYNNKHFK